MIRKLRICCILMLFFVATESALCITVSKENDEMPISSMVQQTSKSESNENTYLSVDKNMKSSVNEKRPSPAFDKIIGEDGLYHYRVFFWVPKEATKFMPYADNRVITDVSSHGPVEKWSVVETKIVNDSEKLVFIFVPKTFVYLYGKGFEKVIHIKYS